MENRSTDPKGSDTQAGQTTYEDLYADPLLWVQKGWLDYLAPQVYWSMDYPVASHKKITSWWNNATPNTNLYIGNGTYKIRNNSDKAWDKSNEIPKQLKFSRNLEHVNGNIFFSAKSLIGKHAEVNQKLERKFYRSPVNNPGPLNKVKRTVQLPAILSAKIKNNELDICISHTDSVPRFLDVYEIHGPERKLMAKAYLPESTNSGCFKFEVSKKQSKKILGITIMDPYGNESALQTLNLTSN